MFWLWRLKGWLGDFLVVLVEIRVMGAVAAEAAVELLGAREAPGNVGGVPVRAPRVAQAVVPLGP